MTRITSADLQIHATDYLVNASFLSEEGREVSHTTSRKALEIFTC